MTLRIGRPALPMLPERLGSFFGQDARATVETIAKIFPIHRGQRRDVRLYLYSLAGDTGAVEEFGEDFARDARYLRAIARGKRYFEAAKARGTTSS